MIYIGKGTYTKADKLRRMESHWKANDLRNQLFFNVLQKIRSAGLEPIRQVIAWCDTEQDAFNTEMERISLHRLRKHGGTLCNQTFGGEGPMGNEHTDGVKLLIGAASLRNWANPEYAEKLINKYRVASLIPEVVKAKSDETKRRWEDAEFKSKTSAAIKAAKTTPEARARTSAINTEIWSSIEVREKFSARMKEVLNNPEEKARKVAATKALWADPVFREKMATAKLKNKALKIESLNLGELVNLYS